MPDFVSLRSNVNGGEYGEQKHPNEPGGSRNDVAHRRFLNTQEIYRITVSPGKAQNCMSIA